MDVVKDSSEGKFTQPAALSLRACAYYIYDFRLQVTMPMLKTFKAVEQQKRLGRFLSDRIQRH